LLFSVSTLAQTTDADTVLQRESELALPPFVTLIDSAVKKMPW